MEETPPQKKPSFCVKTFGKLCARRCAQVVAGLTLSLILIASIVGWQAYHGGFNTAFLSGFVERALIGKNPDLELSFDRLDLVWDDDKKAMAVEAKAVTLQNTFNDDNLVRIERVYITLSPFHLLRFKLLPVEMRVEKPVLRLRQEDVNALSGSGQASGLDSGTGSDSGSALSSGISPATEKTKVTSEVAGLLAKPIFTLKKGNSLQALERFLISDIDVELTDAVSDQNWKVNKAFVLFERERQENEDVLSGEFEFDVSVNDTAARFSGDTIYDLTDDEIGISLAFQDISIEKLRQLQPEAFNALPLDTSFDGKVQSFFQILEEDEMPKVSLSYIAFDLSSGAGKIVPNTFLPQPVPFEKTMLKGTFDPVGQGFNIQTLQLDFGGFDVTAKGQANLGGEGLFEASGQMSWVSVEDLLKIWPEQFGYKPRLWASENIKTADFMADFIVKGALNTDQKVSEAGGTIRFKDMTTTYFRTFPAFVGVSGSATYDTTSMDIAVETGQLEKDIVLEEGTLKFSQLDTDLPHGVFDIKLKGPMPTFIDVINRPPLDIAKKYDFEFEAIQEGDASVNLHFDMPLLRDLPAEQVKIEVEGLLSGLKAPQFVHDYDLQDAQLFLNVSMEKMRVSGVVNTAGVPISLEMDQTFNGDGDGKSDGKNAVHYKISADLNDEQQAAVGLDPENFVKGPISVKLDLTQSKTQDALQVSADLSKAAVSITPLDWSKKAGDPMTVSLAGAIQNDLLEMTSLSANAPDFKVQAAGVANIETREIKGLAIKRLKAGLTDVSGSYVKSVGTSSLKLDGASINLAGFMNSTAQPAQPSKSEKTGADASDSGVVENDMVVGVDLSVEKAWFGAEVPLNQFSLKALYDLGHKKTLSMELSAETTNHEPLSSAVKMGEGPRQFSMTTNDAGGLLKALDIYPNMLKGQMSVEGKFDESKSYDHLIGSMVIRDFAVANAPAMAQLLNLASLTGALESLGKNGIAFQKMVTDFEYYQQIIRLNKMEAVGSAMGISAEGNLDLKEDKMDIKGTFAPAYSINQFIGNIPLIGDILTGGGAEDLIAARYSIQGTLEDPDVSFNPVSALTPGFLRGIFSTDIEKIEREEEPVEPLKTPASPLDQISPSPENGAAAPSL